MHTRVSSEEKGSAGKGFRLNNKKPRQNNTQRQHLLKDKWKQETVRSSEREITTRSMRQIKQIPKWQVEAEERETKYMKMKKKGTKCPQKQVRQDRRSRSRKEQDKRTGVEPMSWEHKDQGFLP